MGTASAASTSSNPFPVHPTGFLIGSYIALILYGLHLTQLHSYFSKYKYDSLKKRLLVLWVFVLSTFQVVIIIAAGWKYFVGGLYDGGKIWGEFWDPLSVQDGLIPLMAFTAQVFFGNRAWQLWGRRPWIKWFFTTVPAITMLCGVALAVTARIWSEDPFVSHDKLHGRPISIPSQVVAILWMGLSAFTDGVLTLLLLARFFRSRATAASPSSVSIVSRLIALTLETVLLTHLVGATMCIIFLASPPAARTRHPLFWILLEIITELYALSILFTINARNPAKDGLDGISGGGRPDAESRATAIMGQTELDARVEGYQGSTPFGVRMIIPSLGYQNSSMGYVGESSEPGTGGMSSAGQDSADIITPRLRDEGKCGWPGTELGRLDSADKYGSDNLRKEQPRSPLEHPL